MPLATITEIRPNGGFNLDDGSRMYTNMVYFDDNTYGNANTKSQIAPYKVGDQVSYEITGNYKGTPKLKVQKAQFAGSPARSAAPKPVAPQAAPTQVARTSEVSPINGASVGMAMNNALTLLTRDLDHTDIIGRLCEPSFWQAVQETTSDILRVSRHIEAGHLAPSVRERAAGSANRSANVSQPRPAEPQYHYNAPDDDVPF